MHAADEASTNPNPISRPVNVMTLPNKGLVVELRPDAGERQALAAFNDLLAIDDFAADIKVQRWQRDGVRVTGDIQASVTQACTVTLEPVSQYLETGIDAVFVAAGSTLDKDLQKGEAHEILIDPEGDDAPEPFDHPWLDVGDAVQEFFALALDPWPRAPGADALLEGQMPANGAAEPEDEKPNPFAALARLKDKP